MEEQGMPMRQDDILVVYKCKKYATRTQEEIVGNQCCIFTTIFGNLKKRKMYAYIN